MLRERRTSSRQDHTGESATIDEGQAETTALSLSDPVRGVLFDFDGTLLDSFPIHFKAYRTTFARFGIRITEADFRNCYSPDWNRVYEAMGLPRKEWELASEYWLQEAAKEAPPLFQGVQQMLTDFQRWYAIGLVTSGSRDRIHKDLQRTGVQDCFQVVITGDDVRTPKPSPEGLQTALAKLGLPPHAVVYVGDTDADYAMAKAAHVKFIGVSSKFSPSRSALNYPRLKSILEMREVYLRETR